MAKNNRAFTLVELLVVVAVLLVLSVVLLTALNPVQQMKKSRDARRRSDLNQYREALEAFASVNNSLYPATDCGSSGASSCNGNSVNDNGIFDSAANSALVDEFMSAHLEDPVNDANYNYRYHFWNSGLDYKLAARLEAPDATTFYIVCSNGRVGNSGTYAESGNSCDIP